MKICTLSVSERQSESLVVVKRINVGIYDYGIDHSTLPEIKQTGYLDDIRPELKASLELMLSNDINKIEFKDNSSIEIKHIDNPNDDILDYIIYIERKI